MRVVVVFDLGSPQVGPVKAEPALSSSVDVDEHSPVVLDQPHVVEVQVEQFTVDGQVDVPCQIQEPEAQYPLNFDLATFSSLSVHFVEYEKK